MNMSLTGWSPIGIGATVLIIAGICLVIAYALRRGLHHRELEGMDPDPGTTEAAPASQPMVGADLRDSWRTVGAAGAAVLAIGLILGILAATGGWGTQQAQGPGTAPLDCAQAWNGCPQATARP